jgi:hypothetical protein
MSFIFGIGFLFVIFKVAINYTNGYLVHYATYMASRAYMVVDTNSNQPDGSDGAAAQRAQQVFAKYKAEAIIPSLAGALQVNNPGAVMPAFVGTWVEYTDKFTFSSLFGGNEDVTFRSESFLGREPTRSECLQQICAAMAEPPLSSDCDLHVTFYDNGC